MQVGQEMEGNGKISEIYMGDYYKYIHVAPSFPFTCELNQNGQMLRSHDHGNHILLHRCYPLGALHLVRFCSTYRKKHHFAANMY